MPSPPDPSLFPHTFFPSNFLFSFLIPIESLSCFLYASQSLYPWRKLSLPPYTGPISSNPNRELITGCHLVGLDLPLWINVRPCCWALALAAGPQSCAARRWPTVLLTCSWVMAEKLSPSASYCMFGFDCAFIFLTICCSPLVTEGGTVLSWWISVWGWGWEYNNSVWCRHSTEKLYMTYLTGSPNLVRRSLGWTK